MRLTKNLGLLILFGVSVWARSIVQAAPPDDPTDGKPGGNEFPRAGCFHAAEVCRENPKPRSESKRAWRKAFRARMLKVLGRMPDRVPLRVKWIEKQRFDTFTRHKIYIQTEKTYWCPVYYLVPHKLRKRAPAIVCLHGHDGVVPYLGEGRKSGTPRPLLARTFPASLPSMAT
ncbi:MAG: hypothetical protein CM1200mP2_27000 [Planctomycetaceae bacterium]|nr:MAG: hypothetical protein CM1200mP2_27000 [Planctomycetaceae bacterium]